MINRCDGHETRFEKIPRFNKILRFDKIKKFDKIQGFVPNQWSHVTISKRVTDSGFAFEGLQLKRLLVTPHLPSL